LALLGGILGILLAFWGTRILNTWIAASPDYWSRNFRPVMNVRVLAVTLGLCLMATLLSGLRPALWLSKCDIAGEMKGSSGRILGLLRRRRSALSVAGQVTLAVALVLCATLLMRSALQIARPDARFPLTNKLIVQIDPDSTGYERDRTTRICKVLADHLASLPGVKAMGTSGGLFYGGGGPVSIGEYQPGMGQRGSKGFLAQECALVNVGRDYFEAMEIPLLQGRFFDQRDVPDAEKVTIIDEALALKLRPDGNALGCFIQWGVMNDRSDPYRVIGIVANMPGVGSRTVRAQMYEPAQSDHLFSYLYFLVTGRDSAGILQQRLAKEIHRIAPRVPVLSVAMLTKIRNDHVYIWVARFGARLGLAAGVTALFLAALGIYAIKGYLVASRTSEIGIRKALGATHGSIIGMVLQEGLVLTMVALIVGLGLGLAVAKLSARMLYGISPIDPVSIVVTTFMLGIVSLLASYIPARRAAKIDPMEALRYE
jgi:predicted permease